MTKYQLAKLIQLAGGINSRKRVQKTVHLLQAAGCPLEVSDYRLHFYGPYSFELAEQLDSMVKSEILVESQCETQFGPQFNYQFNSDFTESLETFESTSRGRELKTDLEGYQTLLTQLSDKGSRVLELASTIVSFREGGNSREIAISETADFKREDVQSQSMQEAQDLAEDVLNWTHVEH